jgi:para-aminobenzoate synthetase
MIVDLIRHDLHGVVGDDVSVKQFCRVEEYETIWQMVSVIEGARPITGLDVDSTTLGWEVLKRSLPPGESICHFLVYSVCDDGFQGA